MNPPEKVLNAVEATLEGEYGRKVRITSSRSVGGGCINPSVRLASDSGDHFFLKWNESTARGMFAAEADGLKALARPGFLRVPQVLGHGGGGGSHDPGWLLLEFVPAGHPDPDYGRHMGEGLAELHSSALKGSALGGTGPYGWPQDNFIGSLPQENGPSSSWTTFWRERRLEPQISMARDGGHFSSGRGGILDRLLERLDSIMEGADEAGPALLHGDLWSGNFYPGPGGEPVLIDPAVYQGSGEVDLAMMELFGDLPRGFLDAYAEQRGLAPEYDAFRRDLYQLYYLLVHVNLFGGGYVAGSLSAAEKAMRGA